MVIVCAVAAGVCVCVAVCLSHAYWIDARRLRKIARRLTEGMSRSDLRVQALNSFVYRAEGFAKNGSYYLVKSLGPTPVQVLEQGGDCSDKSRLLAALLQQLGIKASLAMLYRHPGCVAVHTVVLAETESGTIVADPAFDLMFPDAGGRYHDVRRMIAEPRLLSGRLQVLRAQRGPDDRIGSYDESAYRYDFVTTINWARYRWLGALSRALRRLALEPRLIRRPALLENPKLLLATLSGVGGALLTILTVVCRGSGG